MEKCWIKCTDKKGDYIRINYFLTSLVYRLNDEAIYLLTQIGKYIFIHVTEKLNCLVSILIDKKDIER